MRRVLVSVLGLLTTAISVSAGAQNPGEVVAFQTSVKVAVDARGHPVETEASPALSAGVREFVEARARDLVFEPALVDGHARGGVTYVVFGVCAVPDGDQMRMAAEYRMHGPGQADGAAHPSPPRYPVEAARRGLSADMTVHYVVRPDGTATLERVEFAEDDEARGRRLFERMARDWVASMQVLPEEVDGQPVTTQVSTPVMLALANAGSDRAQAMLENMRDSQAGSAECNAGERTQSGRPGVTARSAFVIREAG